MGLDMYIDKCRKPKIVNGKREYEEREEVCYWRKFWMLLREGLPFKYGNEEYGQDIRLSKDGFPSMHYTSLAISLPSTEGNYINMK